MDASSTLSMALAHLASGALAAGMATMTTQPLDNAVVRSQLSRILRKEGHPISLSGTTESEAGNGHSKDESIAALLAREGGLRLPSVRRMFREADVGRRGIEAGVFFGVYSLLKGARADVYGPSSAVPALEELGLGLLSGAVGRGAGIGVSNLLSSSSSSDTSSFPHRRGRKGALKGDLRKLRIRHVVASVDRVLNGVFRGYFSGGFVRGAVEPGITLAVEQVLARVLLGDGRKSSVLEVFVLAVVGKVIATLATYPFRTARARMVVARSEEVVSGLGDGAGGSQGMNQNASAQDEKLIDLSDTEKVVLGEMEGSSQGRPKYASVFEAMRHVYRTEGVVALYDGVGSEVLRAVVHHAILMVGKELVHQFILRAALAVTTFWNRKIMMGSTAKMGSSAMKARQAVPSVPKVPAPSMRHVVPLDKASPSTPPAPVMHRIRSLHTGQHLPLPGERPWDIQQHAPTVRLASPAGETDMSRLMREKPWNLQQSAANTTASGPDFGDRLGGLKGPAPKWTEMLPNLPWRKRPVDDETGSLVTNMLGDGSRHV